MRCKTRCKMRCKAREVNREEREEELRDSPPSVLRKWIFLIKRQLSDA